jgi:hypothetical protein
VSSSDFQPLIPEERALGPLVERAAELIAEGHQLSSQAGALTVPLRPLLRSMNSYYTNRIEGQHTRPADIDRALAHHFDADVSLASKQRLAIAHIETEALLSLLDFGVLASESPRAEVRFAVPQASLRFLFPNLWPEAEADAEFRR